MYTTHTLTHTQHTCPALQHFCELAGPLVKVVIDAAVIIAVTPSKQGAGSQGFQGSERFLAHGVEVLVLLVA